MTAYEVAFVFAVLWRLAFMRKRRKRGGSVEREKEKEGSGETNGGWELLMGF